MRRRNLIGAILAAPFVLPCAELAPGARIVSHDYPLDSWPADRTLEFDVPEKESLMLSARTQLFLYVLR